MSEYAVMPKSHYVALCDWIRERLNTEGGIVSGNLISMLEEVVSFTDDADAIASDIAAGKSAWVKGKKIEGSLHEITNGILYRGQEVKSYDSDLIRIGLIAPMDYLIRKGANLSVLAELASFGNCLAEQVPKGVTFTSASGFLIEGTREDSSSDSEYLNELMEWSIAAYSTVLTVVVLNKHPTKCLEAKITITEVGGRTEEMHVGVSPDSDYSFEINAYYQGAQWDINITEVRFAEE